MSTETLPSPTTTTPEAATPPTDQAESLIQFDAWLDDHQLPTADEYTKRFVTVAASTELPDGSGELADGSVLPADKYRSLADRIANLPTQLEAQRGMRTDILRTPSADMLSDEAKTEFGDKATPGSFAASERFKDLDETEIFEQYRKDAANRLLLADDFLNPNTDPRYTREVAAPASSGAADDRDDFEFETEGEFRLNEDRTRSAGAAPAVPKEGKKTIKSQTRTTEQMHNLTRDSLMPDHEDLESRVALKHRETYYDTGDKGENLGLSDELMSKIAFERALTSEQLMDLTPADRKLLGPTLLKASTQRIKELIGEDNYRQLQQQEREAAQPGGQRNIHRKSSAETIGTDDEAHIEDAESASTQSWADRLAELRADPSNPDNAEARNFRSLIEESDRTEAEDARRNLRSKRGLGRTALSFMDSIKGKLQERVERVRQNQEAANVALQKDNETTWEFTRAVAERHAAEAAEAAESKRAVAEARAATDEALGAATPAVEASDSDAAEDTAAVTVTTTPGRIARARQAGKNVSQKAFAKVRRSRRPS